ncbi:multiple antibiotic resistance protein [Maritalea mobilis]|uniref:UPF0056 membrane protein n=1 Tax=Maritalea mobilis TaxID=483324 RepID=A0A4V3DAF5_9HYPH|nr:MarC family protein [Maritalea mobilis]TDQ61860.1 multiple antibiotic resistance protein [Maritalea mobilis]
MPIETFLVSFTTYFATIGPADIVVLFAALTAGATAAERRAMVFKGVVIGGAVLLFFVFFGEPLLSIFGISLPALRTAGGILLLLIAIDMVFARSSGGTSTTDEENAEAASSSDISVFPLATPLIAGPGAIGATILLMADASGDPPRQVAVVAGLLLILMLTYLFLLGATQLQRILGFTVLHVISRIVGVLLAALSVQFIFDGLMTSGLLGRMSL